MMNSKENVASDDEDNELVYYEVPTYMDIQPCKLFKEEISKRGEFATFVNNIEGLNSFVDTIVRTYSTPHILTWIGGSRAWKKAHKEYFKNEPLDVLTESAMLSAGNYDIFMIFDDKQLLMEKFKEVKKTIETYIKELSLRLVDNYSLEIKYVKGASIKEDEMLEMCALFPCKSIAVEITFVPSSKRKTRNSNSVNFSRSASSNSSVISSPSSQASASSLNSERTKDLPNVNNKLLFYLELSYLKDVKIDSFREEFLNGNYLNPNGLFMFSQFLKSPRTDKGINVDILRDNFMKKVIGKEKSMSMLLYQTAEKYENVFGISYKYHQHFLDFLYMKAVYQLHEEEHHYDVEKYYTYNVMEILRPMINSCIVMYSNVLKETFEKTFLLVVGGDAMRRYKDDITMTSDIDTKLYYDREMKPTQKRSLINLTLAFMSLFVTIMNYTYKINVDDIYKLHSKNNNNAYKIFLPKLQQFTENEAIEHMINKNQIHIYHFRLRYIEESCEFPVDLFSIDLNIPVIVKIENKEEFRSHITIPVFDMVLQKNDGSVSMKESIHDYTNTTVPVASLDFLKKDLDNTYSNVRKSRLRFNNDKVVKDKKRLDELYQLNQDDYSPNLDRLFDDKDLVVDRKNDISLLIKRDTSLYLKKMKGVISKNHKKHILKHKIPFKRSKIEKIEGSSAEYDFENNVYSKLNTVSAFNVVSGGGKRTPSVKYGEQLAKYIKHRNSKLYKLIKLKNICYKNSLELDKYIFEFLNKKI